MRTVWSRARAATRRRRGATRAASTGRRIASARKLRTMRSAQRRRARWAAVVAVVAIALLAVWWTRRGYPAAPKAARPAAPVTRTAAAKPWAVRIPPAVAKVEAGREADRARVGL